MKFPWISREIKTYLDLLVLGIVEMWGSTLLSTQSTKNRCNTYICMQKRGDEQRETERQRKNGISSASSSSILFVRWKQVRDQNRDTNLPFRILQRYHQRRHRHVIMCQRAVSKCLKHKVEGKLKGGVEDRMDRKRCRQRVDRQTPNMWCNITQIHTLSTNIYRRTIQLGHSRGYNEL